MQIDIFHIILLALVIVVILHLISSDDLFGIFDCRKSKEHMFGLFGDDNDNTSNKKINNNDNYSDNYSDNGYRDPNTRGIDRTDKSKEWYHYNNRLVDNNIVDDDMNSGDDYNYLKRINNPNNFSEKLVFINKYENNNSSDPFDSAIDNKIPKNFDSFYGRSNEKLVDVNGNSCDNVGVNENDDIKRYIRDYVLDGYTHCGCVTDKSKSDHTREEIEAYREKQLEFRDKIYGTSAPAIDPVDKMNNITMNGGIKASGQSIGSFYDNLVNNDSYSSQIKKPLPSTQCVKTPIFDNESGIPSGYYKKKLNNGQEYITRDNWEYNNENPNNGGILYDGIYGNDDLYDGNRIV